MSNPHSAEADEKCISVGSIVVIEKDGPESRKEFTIVLSRQSNASANEISDLSPIGAALMGKRAGESVTLKVPSGEIRYSIVEVR